jgi:hypothetical protein
MFIMNLSIFVHINKGWGILRNDKFNKLSRIWKLITKWSLGVHKVWVLWTCCSKGTNKSKNTHGAYYTRMKWYYKKKHLQKLIHDKELKMSGMNWTRILF